MTPHAMNFPPDGESVPPPRRKSPPIAAGCRTPLLFPLFGAVSSSLPREKASRKSLHLFHGEIARASLNVARIGGGDGERWRVADPPQELLSFPFAFPPFLQGVNFRARTRRSAARDRGRVKVCLYVVLNTSVRAREDTPLRGHGADSDSAERRTEARRGL